MTVRLRPHHLLCVLTYVGKGYNPAFTAAMTAIVSRVASGEDTEIVEGPDDICAALLDDPQAHCHRSSVAERDRAAARDIGSLLGLEIRSGTSLVFGAALLRQLRASFASGDIRSACEACEWFELCGSIAASRYEGVLLDRHR